MGKAGRMRPAFFSAFLIKMGGNGRMLARLAASGVCEGKNGRIYVNVCCKIWRIIIC